MPGALQTLSTPPAPNPDAQMGQGALQGGNGAPGPMAPPQGGQPQQPPPMPAPTHAHTVAAMRHFHALGEPLEAALKDPDLGKSDIKGKVIEGMTKLVARRIISPAQAVTQLATFPERPFDQKRWLGDHLMQIKQAELGVLSHHGMAFAGGGPEAGPHPDNHMQDVAGMMQAHYAGGGRA